MQSFKGLLLANLISKMTIPDSQRYPLSFYLINDVEDIVIFFLGLKVFSSDNSHIFSCSENAQFTLAEHPQYN